MTTALSDHGTVCWIDIGAQNQPQTATFYETLFGWTYTTPDADGYQIAQLHGLAVSGLGQAENPGLPYWTIILGAADIEATFAACINAGATGIEEPSPVHALGRSAIVTDPWGAPVSLWQPGTRGGMQLRGEHATLATVELFSTRPKETAMFYAEVMGWQSNGHQLTNRGTPVAWVTDAPLPEPSCHGSSWLAHFATNNLGDTTDRAIALGAEHVRVASRADVVLRDPEGAFLGLTGIN